MVIGDSDGIYKILNPWSKCKTINSLEFVNESKILNPKTYVSMSFSKNSKLLALLLADGLKVVVIETVNFSIVVKFELDQVVHTI